MATEVLTETRPSGNGAPVGHEWSISRPVLGLLMFIGTEVMFFGGLISVFLILRAGSEAWPPPDQPRLPLAVTVVNTALLLISGWSMRRAGMAFRGSNRSGLMLWLTVTSVLGGLFLLIQGSEWLRLIDYGLTMTSSTYGGTFYALIGCHALHVLGALLFLLLVFRKALARTFLRDGQVWLELCSIYWYFVVAVWPVLFVLVYLA